MRWITALTVLIAQLIITCVWSTSIGLVTTSTNQPKQPTCFHVHNHTCVNVIVCHAIMIGKKLYHLMCVFALRIASQMLQNAHPKPAAPAGEGDLELGVALGRGHFLPKSGPKKRQVLASNNSIRACVALESFALQR